MKTTKNLLALALIATAFTGSALAQTNVASQQVSVNVSEIAVIAMHGNINLTINTATAGQEPEPATAASTYDVSTNGSNKKISAQLDTNMPKDLKLFATMAAPNSATSTGRKELKDTSVDLVTGITKVPAQVSPSPTKLRPRSRQLRTMSSARSPTPLRTTDQELLPFPSPLVECGNRVIRNADCWTGGLKARPVFCIMAQFDHQSEHSCHAAFSSM